MTEMSGIGLWKEKKEPSAWAGSHEDVRLNSTLLNTQESAFKQEIKDSLQEKEVMKRLD
jgi:hypothetical protein